MKGHISHVVPPEFYLEPNTYKDPFLEAIKSKDVDTVKSMLLAGTADVNKATKDGFTPIYFAIAYRAFSIAKVLLEHGADPNHTFHIGGITPLFLAVNTDDAEMFKILAEGGGDIFAVDDFGNNVAHYCAFKGSIPRDLFQYLYERGFDFTVGNADNANIIAIAAYSHICKQSVRMRNSDAFIKFVTLAKDYVELNTDINDCPLFSLQKLGLWTPDMKEDYSDAVTGRLNNLGSFITLASALRQLQLSNDTVSALVKLGMRIPASDEELLLSLIVPSGQTRAVANFIAAGGDPFTPLVHGYSSVALAAACGKHELLDALCLLCDNLAEKRGLILDDAFDSAVQYLHRHHEMTPLLAAFASEDNVLKLFDVLSHYGYDLSRRYDKDLKGLTPLAYAITSANWVAMSCLLELGANPDVRVPVASVIELLREEEDNTEEMMVPLRHLALGGDIYPLELALVMAADEEDIAPMLLNAGSRWRKDVRGQDIVSFIDQYAPESSRIVRLASEFNKQYIEKSFFERLKKDVERSEHIFKAPPSTPSPPKRDFSTTRVTATSPAVASVVGRSGLQVITRRVGYAPVVQPTTSALVRAARLAKFL